MPAGGPRGARRPKRGEEEAGGEGGAGGLTDRDVLAILVREPFHGMTPELYARTSDRVILDVYLAERDEDGTLITEGGRDLTAGMQRKLDKGERLLPSPEAINVPREVQRSPLYQLQPSWVLMFWQTWAARGKSPQEISERYFRVTAGANEAKRKAVGKRRG